MQSTQPLLNLTSSSPSLELVNFEDSKSPKQKIILHIFNSLLAGFYKPSETEVYDESSPGGNFDFLSKLCTDWESAAKLRPDAGVRQVTIRYT